MAANPDAGNCFAGNDFSTSLPRFIERDAPCAGGEAVATEFDGAIDFAGTILAQQAQIERAYVLYRMNEKAQALSGAKDARRVVDKAPAGDVGDGVDRACLLRGAHGTNVDARRPQELVPQRRVGEGQPEAAPRPEEGATDQGVTVCVKAAGRVSFYCRFGRLSCP